MEKKQKPITKSIKITSCLECPFHQVIPDPDPHDSFDMDDEAVVCKKKLNLKRNLSSAHAADRSEYRSISVANRPYQITKENIKIPVWCPL